MWGMTSYGMTHRASLRQPAGFRVAGKTLQRDDALDFFFDRDFDYGDGQWHMAQVHRLGKRDPERAQLVFWDDDGRPIVVAVHCREDAKLLAPLGAKTTTPEPAPQPRSRWWSRFGRSGNSDEATATSGSAQVAAEHLPEPLDGDPGVMVDPEPEGVIAFDGELPPPAAPTLQYSLTEMAPPRESEEMVSLGRLLFEDAVAGNSFRSPGGLSRSISNADAAPQVGFAVDIGDMVDVREPDTNRWSPATVINMAKDAADQAFAKVEYHSGLVTEWVPLGARRFAQMGKQSTRLHHSFQPGAYIDALDYFPNKYTGELTAKWRVASVLQAEPYRVFIHWEGWSSRFDCWIDVMQEGDRLRPLGRHTVGDGAQAQQERALEQQFAENLAKGDTPLTIHEVSGDGNCLFRSVCHQVYGDDRNHATVRARCMRYVRSNKKHFKQFVDGDFDQYCASRAKDGVWGDNLEIVALAELFDRPVEVWSREAPLNPDGTLEPMRVVQADESSRPVVQIRLTYHGGRHYNSLVNEAHPPPLGELHTTVLRDQRRKKAAEEAKAAASRK